MLAHLASRILGKVLTSIKREKITMNTNNIIFFSGQTGRCFEFSRYPTRGRRKYNCKSRLCKELFPRIFPTRKTADKFDRDVCKRWRGSESHRTSYCSYVHFSKFRAIGSSRSRSATGFLCFTTEPPFIHESSAALRSWNRCSSRDSHQRRLADG